MTLIVGIKCSDGIVLGADGAATLGSMGQMTVRQAVKKLTIVDGRVVVGVSGPVGLSQRFNAEIEALWAGNKFAGKSAIEAMTIIRQKLWDHASFELQVAAVARNTVGPIANQSAIAHTLVALPCQKTPCLLQFDQQGAPEAASDDLPFVAVGSGQGLADPFLAFLRRVFWSKSPPTLADGVFAAVWTLDHAIKSMPGGVAAPMQIVVLESGGKDWRARELAPQDLEEHLQAIGAAEASLSNFRKGFAAPPVDGTAEPPEPPKP